MPSSNKVKNVPTGVTWTRTYPSSAAAVTIDGITNFKYNPGISQKPFSADGTRFDTAVFSDSETPTISFSVEHPYRLQGVAATERGTLSFVIPDAQNGITAGGGGYTWTVTDTFLNDLPSDLKHRDWATAEITFGMIASDGITHPVSRVAF